MVISAKISKKEVSSHHKSERMKLPADFVEMMRQQMGEKEASLLFAALEDSAPVSIRLNPQKPSATFPEETETVGWCSAGLYLRERPQFTMDPLLHAGCYYVQEASSMAIEQAYKALPQQPRRILDLCAAPGGKSTLWASLMPKEALLVCNEPIRNRANVLAENMSKWGNTNTIVTNAYPEDFDGLDNFFDLVAADVPCSGEGMFRKDHEARAEWSMANVRMCADRQLEIVRSIWHTLRPGGFLVYSTCTFNHLEDEDNVRRICEELGAVLVEIPGLSAHLPEAKDAGAGVHFYPHLVRGEGFFVALLQKNGVEQALSDSSTLQSRNKKKSKDRASSAAFSLSSRGRKEELELLSHLRNADMYQLLTLGGEDIYAVRRDLYTDVVSVLKTAAGRKAITAGIPLATPKGRKWQPRPELALSTELAADAFPRAELDYEQAIAFLRHEALSLQSETPRGYVLVCYKGQPLGFVNNLGTRANNLYPSEWRIRKIL